MASLYDTYKKNRYKLYNTGGNVEPVSAAAQESKADFGQTVGFVSSLASGILDATAKPDPTTGRKSTGATIGSGALKGAAMGSQLGPMGAVVGGVVGAGVGLLTANKEKREAMGALKRQVDEENNAALNNSATRIATNPSLVHGYKNSGYFAMGGTMGGGEDPKKPAVFTSQSELDAANKFAKDFAIRRGLVSGEDTFVGRKVGDVKPVITDMTGGMKLSKPKAFSVPSNVQRSDIQTANGSAWYTDPQTGDIVDIDMSVLNQPRFRTPDAVVQTDLANRGVAKLKNGGTIEAPLTRSYLTGGTANSMSSDGTEFNGQSHDEGGIKIPAMGAEVEGQETAKGNYIFSDALGFADIHKKLSKAKGIIEKKPVTAERVNSIKRLNNRENELVMAQEYLKKKLKIA